MHVNSLYCHLMGPSSECTRLIGGLKGSDLLIGGESIANASLWPYTLEGTTGPNPNVRVAGTAWTTRIWGKLLVPRSVGSSDNLDYQKV